VVTVDVTLGYNPDISAERAGVQCGSAQVAFSNHAPDASRPSITGVRMFVSPYADNAVARS
jgi:hypothetical protein